MSFDTRIFTTRGNSGCSPLQIFPGYFFAFLCVLCVFAVKAIIGSK